ncbi:hypothetical protein [Clostridium botulinum]|uniref:Uncharacterized protein n=1 Tax=Clostridium botulinum TaxID=1491 RepID=A0A9Q1UWV8_CLOBO|nr:hypothetical protein [Clostridium botulinum]KEI00373.1 hypothetical protein Y848_11665 [Clostridium botulinum C/D str. Sp77]KLU74834.1 hypothetical protein CBC3_12275 [Clostridium botulinum V891]KOA72638.1 hypothetical protein ADU78_14605 [Clostridium botulinum]KOA79708.1 hypothetical protein ADU77_03760 [Clostridium botulinum]KOA83458.1 hypothetical protein ADU74_12265 [Clostridium botulinum]
MLKNIKFRTIGFLILILCTITLCYKYKNSKTQHLSNLNYNTNTYISTNVTDLICNNLRDINNGTFNNSSNIYPYDKFSKIPFLNNSNKNIRYPSRIIYSRGGTPPANDIYKPSTINTSEKQVELLDWNTAKQIFKRDSKAKVIDVYTHKSFNVQRTMGTNHADTETLTKKDTKIIKEIWDGFSWTRRPVIVEIDGRRLAASMSAMPHAGLDSSPAFVMVNNRSAGFGRGQNLDVIKNNDMDGHFDIHFLNSTRHMDGKKDPQHQNAILVASKSH